MEMETVLLVSKIVLALFLFACFTIALAAQTRISSIFPKIPDITRYEPVKVGKPLAMHSAESKYNITLKTPEDITVPLELFFATPKGKRHVFKVGITYTGLSTQDAASYAVGYTAALFLTACLGVTKQEPIAQWLEEKETVLRENPTVIYEKNFGLLKVGYASAFNRRVLVLQRPDAPRGAWKDTCIVR
jgi:hypothetical protein